MRSILLTFGACAGLVKSQFPSPPVDSIEVISALDPNVTITYKQTELCETTPGVKSFSGFVNLPQSSLYDLDVDFDIHTYFLFFSARKDPENAPLVIYLAGGPGESSAFAAMSGEMSPCYVNLDANSTTLNPWSWNNHANLLFIDQPVGAGFSYTSLINGTHDALEGTIKLLSDYEGGDIPKRNATFGQGTYTDPAPWLTTNTSISAAQALWHFSEHWLTQFPDLKTNNKKIGIWGNSAGGIWAPATAVQIDKKLKEIKTDSCLQEWTIDNVGIVNGLLDFASDVSYYPKFAYNNTYGQFIEKDVYIAAQESYDQRGGCRDLATTCQEAAELGDPLGRGTNETVNSLCVNATMACADNFLILIQYNNFTKVSAFDIALKLNDKYPDNGDPCPYYLPVNTFLNQEWTQKLLGVPLNFTYISNTVLSGFTLKGDALNSGTGGAMRVDKRNLEYLFESDIKVALVAGDRDSRCPWTAAEGFALTANYTAREEFRRAGYEFIQTNATYQGGVVRQFDKLSFSRVFQAGHAASVYQPETVEHIFRRTVLGTDVATGKKDIDGNYRTDGPLDSFNMVEEYLPETPGTCMVAGSFQNESVFARLGQE